MTVYAVTQQNTDEFDVPPTIIVGLWYVIKDLGQNKYLLNRVSRTDYTPIQHVDSSELNVLQDKEEKSEEKEKEGQEKGKEDEEISALREANQCIVHLPGFLFKPGMILEFQPTYNNVGKKNVIKVFLDLYRNHPSCQKVTVLLGDCILFNNSKNGTGWYRCDVLDQVTLDLENK